MKMTKRTTDVIVPGALLLARKPNGETVNVA
jgi:hypothetical protein